MVNQETAETKETDDGSIVVTRQMWEEDAVGVTSVFVSRLGNPVASLAVTIFRLLSEGKMRPEDLLVLGFTRESADALVNVVSTADTPEEVLTQLSITAAIREYDLQIERLMVVHELDMSKRAEFRKELAGFAADNSVTDLLAAFKFMAATEPERIAPFRSEPN